LLEKLPMNQEFLQKWKSKMFSIIKNAEVLISTSNFVADIFEREFDISKKNFQIIPHGRDFQYESGISNNSIFTRFENYKNSNKLKVLLLGNITYHKGSNLIKEISEIDEDQVIEFHFAGKIDSSLEGIGTYHGAYKRENLGALINQINPHIGMVLSICPETFCHTLTELWYSGLPVIGTDLGAVGERIKNTNCGWLVEPQADIIINLVKSTQNNHSDYKDKLYSLNKLNFRTAKEMSFSYQKIYDTVLSGKAKAQVGIFTPKKGRGGSSYIRTYLPYTHSSVSEYSNFHLLNNLDKEELTGYLKKYDISKIVVQRNALNANQLNVIKKNSLTKIFFEIDDNLFLIDENHPEYNQYKSELKLLEDVVHSSDGIITSTQNLNDYFKKYKKPISIIHNKLDEHLWLIKPNTSYRDDKKTIIKLGYFGTYTHESDLSLIEEPFRKAKEILHEEDITLDLEVIGVTKEKSDWYTSIEVPSGFSDYPSFVQWIKTLKWDIGLAPLLKNEINNNKSYIKYLEYTAMGVVGIFSNVGEYSQIINHNFNGKLVNDTEEWKCAIIELSKDNKLREDIIINSTKDLEENHLLNNVKGEILNIVC